MARRVFTVVLTGGIASGKTAVSDSFRQLGVPVIDTDVIAKELVEPGQPALERIAELFGQEVLDPAGGLNRRKMRNEIFSSPDKKALLEGLLHPLIAEEVLRRMEHIGSPYCIIVIPLYAESGSYRWVDRVLVVDVSEEQQIDRVMARDQISRRQAEAILDAQADRQERLALADDVVDNSGSLSELASQVEDLHRKYSSLGSA
ncbi:MAG: dephospho-CoA kinase [Xanthomonadales bacterium]|jgi:dephospho-CoA kinase|nr:dephospho-CoA kinase [Xanthomonadales bacterium]MDH3941520.1 dephospho-CoA kinase [Xanthomonadales bacterium]MDH4000550.1 dephospho-CoA kinase [Xanthomonadales bacterium]